MTIEKEERKMPPKPINPTGARPSQKKNNINTLFKKALQQKQGRVSLSSNILKKRTTEQFDQDEPQQDGRYSTQREAWDDKAIPSLHSDEEENCDFSQPDDPY